MGFFGGIHYLDHDAIQLLALLVATFLSITVE